MAKRNSKSSNLKTRNAKAAAASARRFDDDFAAVAVICQNLARMRHSAVKAGSLAALGLVDQLQCVADAQELRLIELAQS
jgi:hypothetical protein